MNKKLLILTALMLFFASAIFSQTLFDGLDYPFGDKGYNIAGEEYSIAEQINAAAYTVTGYTNIEINEMYPDFVSTTPNRGSTTAVDWYNASDVGDWASSGGKGGIHPGEDWNYGTVLQDLDTIVFTPATGIVWHYRQLSSPVTTSAWAMVIMCVLPTGDSIFIPLCHVTSLTSPPGTICASASDFGFAIGDTVYRGQPVAKIANISGDASHLHLEIRTKFDISDPFWPNGPGGRYPKNDAAYQFGISMEKVAQAYYLMESDGIIDASDFIDAHRPSLFETESCFDPPITWQNTIGGSSSEFLSSIQQTSDGGYILGGYSSSGISGDKTEASMGYDYWVIKLDSTGLIEWQNTIGGSLDDHLADISITTDGGYILSGWSYSNISGDKTEASLGGADYWIVKLDNTGFIEWDNAIGGNSGDIPQAIDQTSDGGCIIGGFSYSGISGDKTEGNIGLGDYWVIKLSNTGVLQWQNTIGGSEFDGLSSIQQTSDGGYIVGGSSQSGLSGDKTEENLGFYDYWIVKLSSSGFIEWDNTIGADGDNELQSISQTSDGGYIVGGYSNSGISGDKTEAAIGSGDAWIIKLNSTGYIEWQNTIGGSSIDLAKSITTTSDGGYIFSGHSNSGISGDKTETCLGLNDLWIVKLNDFGSIEWDNTIGGSGTDAYPIISQTIDGGYILGGTSNSGISGDKTEESINDDFWIIKLSCYGCIPEIVSISTGGPTTFCQGGSVILTATYTGASVQWKKNGIDIAGATSSTYTATTTGTYAAVTTGICGSVTSTEISVVANKNPTATITAGGPTTFCSGESVVLTANAGGGLSYQWYKGATAIVGATSINYTATTTGNYKCRVTKTATGCFKNSNAISVSVTCKEGLSSENSLLSPNPASDYIYLNLDQFVSNNIEIIVINNIGQIVLKKLIFDQNGIDVTMLSKGMYVINLIQDGKFVHSEKFIIE